MAKKIIDLGNTTDDSTGDYLRQGGVKINDNFEEAYKLLGDEANFHPAGAYQNWSYTDGNTLNINKGEAWTVDTTGGSVLVQFPAMTTDDYGTVIRLRDVANSWGSNSCIVQPDVGDWIGGVNSSVSFVTNFADLQFTYTAPNTWRYIKKTLDTPATITDTSGYEYRDFIVDAGTAANPVFTGLSTAGYNKDAVMVSRNGVRLFYKDTLANFDDTIAEYGGDDGGSIGPLDGVTIRLKDNPDIGDIITVEWFGKDIVTSQTSYREWSATIWGEVATPPTGQGTYIHDPVHDGDNALIPEGSRKKVYTLSDFGAPADDEFNPASLQIFLNGTLLTRSGTSGGYTGTDEYELSQDGFTRWNTITFLTPLIHLSVVKLVSFNNEIGTILEWEGTGGIKDKVEDEFLASRYTFTRKNKIRYTDQSDSSSWEAVAGEETGIRWESVTDLIDSIYPIGSIYENASNSANPFDYMGYGVWIPIGQSKFTVGYDNRQDNAGNYDPDFGLDDQDVPQAGGTGGNKQVELQADQIPELSSTSQYMREVDTGETSDVDLESCLPTPGSTVPVASWKWDTVSVNEAETPGDGPKDVVTLPPYLVIYRWLRVG